jgi:sodium transport system ATP-binding protein
MDSIVVKDLKKTFKLSKKQQKLEPNSSTQKVAVDAVSFSVKKGEIYGLLGPNGAGKTTTLRIIASLIKADEGDAWIEGVSVKDHPAEVRKNIGFLTSELKLDDFFTPNYLADYFGRLHGLEETVLRERKEALFTQFGIHPFKEVKVADLSTGMKQKVSLVISILHNPNVIIFDEPTNGLDILTAKTVTDFLIDLKAQGKTIILSTHIFELVEKLCDRVGIIIHGKMSLSEDVSTLMKTQRLEDVFFNLFAASEASYA